MSFRLGIIGYAPPPHIQAAQAFIDNLKKFPTKHELLLYSDYDWSGVLKLKQSPEHFFNPEQKQTWPHKFALNNLLFFTGMQLAIKSGYSHVIYIESDCRVNKVGWDDIMFEEFFGIGKPLIAGGTLAVYNPSSWNMKAFKKWGELIAGNVKRNLPVATYGWKGASDRSPSCVFPNGAFSVLNMAWMEHLFNFNDGTVKLAEHPCPWDMYLGMQVFDTFFEEAYDVMGMMNTIFSSYGDILSTQQERQNMLTSGERIGIHQVKDSWQP